MSKGFQYTTALDKIRRMTKRIKVIPGGTSASKTFSIIPILIDKCAREKISVSIVSESMPHLRKGAMRDFLNIMKMTNRYVDSHWNRSNSIYYFANGSYIEFFSADSADKLRGSRRDILFVNECNNISEESYIQLAMRTSKDIYLDYNPSHKFWIDNVLKSDESEKLTLTYKDNEALAPTIIKFLEDKRRLALTSDYWKNWCKVYLDGQEGRLEGVVFDDWKTIDYIPENAELLGYGMDFGFTNDPTTLIGVYRIDDKIILDEVIYQTGLTNNQIANIIKQEQITKEIYADSAEPKSIQEIRNYGIKIFPAKKGKDSILFGIQLMQEHNLYVTKRSVNIKKEFERYSWKKDRDGNVTNTPIDNFNHTIDAIRYLFASKLANHNGGISVY
jgi:phage terminase large subunit